MPDGSQIDGFSCRVGRVLRTRRPIVLRDVSRTDLPLGATVVLCRPPRAGVRSVRASCVRVVELEICTWHTTRYDSRVIVSPSDDDIAQAIAQLNGVERNDLYLRDGSGSWMGIAGGPDRVIVTFAAGHEGPFSQAVDQTAPPGPQVEIVVGGQMITQSPKGLLAASVATDVACDFARTGQRSTSLTWQET